MALNQQFTQKLPGQPDTASKLSSELGSTTNKLAGGLGGGLLGSSSGGTLEGSFDGKVLKEDAVESIPIDEKVTEKQKKLDDKLDTEGQFVNSDGGRFEDEDDDDIGIDEEEREEIRQEASKEFEKVSQGKENVDLDGFKDIVKAPSHHDLLAKIRPLPAKVR